MDNYMAHWWKPVHLKIRCNQTRWVVLRWPTPSMAQQAKMSTDAFEDFFFAVCGLDYAKLSEAMGGYGDRVPADHRRGLADSCLRGIRLRFRRRRDRSQWAMDGLEGPV